MGFFRRCEQRLTVFGLAPERSERAAARAVVTTAGAADKNLRALGSPKVASTPAPSLQRSSLPQQRPGSGTMQERLPC